MKTKSADKKLSLVALSPDEELETQSTHKNERLELLNPLHKANGVTIGKLVGLVKNRPMVIYPAYSNLEGIVAKTIVPITSEKISKEVLLSFIDNDPAQPVIMGFLIEASKENNENDLVKVEIDGERLLLTADREIVLQCGEASITLTRAGKVLIKGAYVLSRSSGYNKIKGAAIDIN